MKLNELVEGIQARTQRWRHRRAGGDDFEEELEIFAELAPDLEPGGREYIGTIHLERDFESQITLPMMREFRKKMNALYKQQGGEEWLVDERYTLIMDLLLKYQLAVKA